MAVTASRGEGRRVRARALPEETGRKRQKPKTLSRSKGEADGTQGRRRQTQCVWGLEGAGLHGWREGRWETVLKRCPSPGRGEA